MPKELPQMQIKRKTGDERFHSSGDDLGFDLLSFWRWADSDLVGNTSRGRLAEYIVARAVGLGESDIGNDWNAFDLLTPSGLKLEIKSSSYVQTWFQKDFSKITFSIRQARKWDPSTNLLDDIPERQSDIYVFALLKHRDQTTIDPLNVDQWEFYVVPTSIINTHKGDQRSVTLKALEELDIRPVGFRELGSTIEREGENISRSV